MGNHGGGLWWKLWWGAMVGTVVGGYGGVYGEGDYGWVLWVESMVGHCQFV